MPAATNGAAHDSVIRIGIVGAGQVAQAVHLPVFALLSHLYRVVAVCDVSMESARHCAAKFHIPRVCASFEELVADMEVDLVMILTADEYHAVYAVKAADAGKHVFIEKPMALSHVDAKAIQAAQDRNGVVVFVGYMRRYAPALELAKSEVKSMDKIHYVRVRDIIGPNQIFVDENGTFPLTFTDFPPSAGEERAALNKSIMAAALGSRAEDQSLCFTLRILGGLGSHDLSAMREILGGMPSRCVGATRATTAPFLTAMFQYDGGGFPVTYETGLDGTANFDASIEIIGDKKRVKVIYDTPYVKGLPITVEIREADAETGHYTERVVRPTYKDPYTIQFEELYACLREGKPVKTDPVDAAEDLKIFDMILNAL